MFLVRSNAIKAGEDLAKKIMERKKKEAYSCASISNLVSAAPKKLVIRHHGKHTSSHSKKEHRRASSEISTGSNSSSLTMDSAIIPTEERKRSAVQSYNRPPRKVSIACNDGETKSKNGLDMDALTA